MQDGAEYAIKVINFSKFSQKEKDNALNEVSILANVKHRNVIRFHEAFLTDDSHQLW